MPLTDIDLDEVSFEKEKSKKKEIKLSFSDLGAKRKPKTPEEIRKENFKRK